jgi:hypothetical protein
MWLETPLLKSKGITPRWIIRTLLLLFIVWYILDFFRYEITAVDAENLFRLDRLTGKSIDAMWDALF